VWQAENQQKVHKGQSGSRPNQWAIDFVLRKEMRYMYTIVTRTQLGTIDNDAKSCFDRIVCCIAMMISRHNGIPINFCKIQATALKESVFRLRTALGESKILTNIQINPQYTERVKAVVPAQLYG
jgi:hypothetical protein